MKRPLTYATLTPQGRGAIAVVEIAGHRVDGVLDACFVPVANKPIGQVPRDIIYGVWKSTGEDLLLVRSGVQRFEIQCHGSQAVLAAIIDDLKSHGAASATSAGAERPANMGSGMDSEKSIADVFRDEIETLMQSAGTERAALLLLRQWTLFPQAVEQILSNSDDNTDTGADTKEDTEFGQSKIAAMLTAAPFGLNFHRTRSVVLCGLPNAGKSSLLNRLLGFTRAIVNPMAGTTRDIVSQATAMDGWAVQLSDTAGVRDTQSEIEKIGVAKAKESIAVADVVVAIVDATTAIGETVKGKTPVGEMEFQSLPADLPKTPDIIVINKVDLIEPAKITQVEMSMKEQWPAAVCVATSAETGNGLTELIEAISTVLCPSLPPDELPIPTTENQIDWLRERSRRSV